MKMRMLFPFFVLVLALIASACAPAAPVTPQLPETGTGIDPAANENIRNAARAFIGQQAGTTADQVEIFSIMNVDWPDACLGLPEAEEACAEVITSGYQVTALVDGQPYVVRTNLDASVIRLGDAEGLNLQPGMGEGAGTVAPEDVLEEAVLFLSQLTNLPLDQVQLGAVTAEEWPDACLGLPEADEMCAQMITPGYRFTFLVENQAYEVRTDANATVIRVAQITQ
jgi:repressor of nif and glnA expression